MQSSIQSGINIDQGLQNLNDWYNNYLQNKLKTETTYNSNSFSGKIRGLLESFNNPVGFLIIVLIIVFVYKR